MNFIIKKGIDCSWCVDLMKKTLMQHFAIKEIKDKDWDLSISKYREIEYEEVEYEKPSVIKKKIIQLEEDILKGLRGLEV